MDQTDITVKPLPDLYRTGTRKDSLDPSDPIFMPLLLAIEEPTTLAFRNDRSMTDGAVLATLDKLCQNPEGTYPYEPLAGRVQNHLKLVVAANNYSRQDVRLALRTVKQSATRHDKQGGTRGYLTFIDDLLPRK